MINITIKYCNGSCVVDNACIHASLAIPVLLPDDDQTMRDTGYDDDDRLVAHLMTGETYYT